ncbi:MAG: hypothetical protein K6B46_02890 [Opitutales bacterium]|nr:hypothetical protein [Opitutales bacterium]
MLQIWDYFCGNILASRINYTIKTSFPRDFTLSKKITVPADCYGNGDFADD